MDDESEFLSIEVLKMAETLDEVSLITHQVELHDTKKGKVLVVQVVSVGPVVVVFSSKCSYVYACVFLCVCVCVCVVSVLICDMKYQ